MNFEVMYFTLYKHLRQLLFTRIWPDLYESGHGQFIWQLAPFYMTSKA